jgi:Tfp pilus assembly protein PilO
MRVPAGWPLVRRVLHEHRRVVIPLAAVLLLNLLAYAIFVYPLSARVDNVTVRTTEAEADLAAALREHAGAKELLAGRARAAERLDRFYARVLPANLTKARQIFSPRLDALARKAGVKTKNVGAERTSDPDHALTRLQMRMSLTGTYDRIRRFIHQVEQAEEFVVIDNVEIAEESADEAELRMQLDLATFFRSAPQ